MNQREDETICVGHIIGAQGLKGMVRVFSNTSPRQNIVSYSPWLLEVDNELRPIKVNGRLQGKNVVAQLEGVDSKDQADELSGVKIHILQEQLPALDGDEYYWSDLIGLKVESLDAEVLGVVDTMMETGADDVMIVKGDRERLIPFVMGDVVHNVDLENQRIIVDWNPDY